MYYDLAFTLQMPLYKMLDEMPYEEFLGWMAFFNARPVGWREDLRTHKLLQVQGVKETAEIVFPSIAQMKESNDAAETAREDGMTDISNLKRSSMFSRMMTAKGGELIS